MRIIEKNPDPTSDIPFVFESAVGQMIANPFYDGDGFTPTTMEDHGFEIWHTGGGCSAHVQRFLMDGKEVHMLIIDTDIDLVHVTEGTKNINVSIMDPDWIECFADWEVAK